MTRRAPRLSLSASLMAMAAALTMTTALEASPLPAHADQVAHAAGFSANQTWSLTLNDPGNPVALSSPNVAELDGHPAVVFGNREGWVYALHLADGSSVAGWPYFAGAPVDSSPSVAPINIFGLDTVYVGSGNASTPFTGGYQAISPSGGDQWFVQESNPPTDPYTHAAVAASLTVGSYAYGYGVEAGSLGQNTEAFAAGNGAMLGGFPWFQGDSVFSTAALADLYSDGNNEIISGGDSSAGIAYGQTYNNGGHIRILSAAGNAGSPSPAGGLLCQYDTNQNIDRSSPAVGQFLANGGVGIAIGDGSYYPGAPDSNKVFAINTGCGLAWSDTLNGITADSPALADVLGNGHLDVVEGTRRERIYVLNGANGAVDLDGPDQRSGHRLPSHRRPDRRGLPGRDRPHHQRDRHLRRTLRCPGGHAWAPTSGSRTLRWSPTTRTVTSASPAPATPSSGEACTASSPTGRSTTPMHRAPRSTRAVLGRSSTTTPS